MNMTITWNDRKTYRDLAIIGLATTALTYGGCKAKSTYQHNQEVKQARIEAPTDATNYLFKSCEPGTEAGVVSIKFDKPIKNHLPLIREHLAQNTQFDYQKNIDGKTFNFKGEYHPDSLEGRAVTAATLKLTKEYGNERTLIFPHVTSNVHEGLSVILYGPYKK